jgi:hypothetical protein
MTVKITAEQVRELLDYRPETGEFFWKISRRGRGFKKGNKAGGINERYFRIGIGGRRYSAHRLAILILTGKWPPLQVDHQDTDGLNNKFQNLRHATATQNQGNCGLSKNNKSGYKGVSWCRAREEWRAYIKINNRNKYLGRFDSPEKAHKAYWMAAQKYFGEFARAA